MIQLETITDKLPRGFATLRAKARAEGFRLVERLATEWEERTTRFNREGEALLVAWVNGELAGIGGVTIDPIIPGALRMRRFYVCPSFRRAGVGRELVTGLLRVNRSRRLITVNAGAESFPFWEALGFKTDKQDGHTHSFGHTETETILISSPRLPLVSFRPFREEDFPQLLAWFRAPHVARTDGQGRPLGFVLTGGEASDYKAAEQLIGLPVARPRLMLADKGYDGDEVRSALLIHGILPVIPPKSNRRTPIPCDFGAYKDRNRIERMFNRLKQFRRIATRYDKTAASFSAFLSLAAAKLWLPTFVNRA